MCIYRCKGMWEYLIQVCMSGEEASWWRYPSDIGNPRITCCCLAIPRQEIKEKLTGKSYYMSRIFLLWRFRQVSERCPTRPPSSLVIKTLPGCQNKWEGTIIGGYQLVITAFFLWSIYSPPVLKVSAFQGSLQPAIGLAWVLYVVKWNELHKCLSYYFLIFTWIWDSLSAPIN